MITSEEIKRRLWEGANELRGSMDASRYKDYMLGLMFYKFLSDKTLESFKVLSGSKTTATDDLVEEYKLGREELGAELDEGLLKYQGYYVEPEHLYQVWVSDINEGTFEVQKVTDGLSNFERTISSTSSGNDFRGLFATNSIDLSDTALGSNLNERSKNVQSLIMLFADLDMVALQKTDTLGDAYEYLIGQFAMESGKKAGEFYTPRQVSEVMAQIVAKSTDISSVYDPTVGSGSLLLTVSSHLDKDKRENLTYYGQELNTATYNLTRMNLILHGVRPARMNIRNANTLAEDWPEDPSRPGEGVQFDAVVMNPPYSVKRWNRNDLKVSDPRFEVAGVLPPASKGDYAFLLHGLYHLGQEGTMAIVLPHGVLFRGGAEGEIRKSLIERNYIDTIIGLPSSLFSNTGIPVVVLILKKSRELGDPVLVIDASKEFIKVGKQNVLQEKDIARIVDTYSDRLELEGYSHLASLKEIRENDFNMNIPRYVEQVDKDIPHDVDGHLYGGIPIDNINSLKLLNTYAKDGLDQALEELRPGYMRLKLSEEDFKELILSNPNIQKKIDHLNQNISTYTDIYLSKLKEIDQIEEIKSLREEMMEELIKLLEGYDYLDLYDGYQMIAQLWNESLNEDTELIAEGDFYRVARQRIPNMVTKGSGRNKREEQDGFVGTLIPNELIKEELYKEEIEEIENLSALFTETDSELSELIEAAKVEDSEEYEALNECLRRNNEGEPGNSFVKGDLNREIKETDEDDDNYPYIKKAIELMDNRTKYSRERNNKTKELDSLVEERILTLTNAEIDQLIELKWFKEVKTEITSLITDPVKEEIDTLIELNGRYSQTLEDLDREIEALEKDFQALLSELVVTK